MRRPGPEDNRLKDCRAKGQCAPDVYESSHRVPQFLYFGFLDTLRCQKVTYLNIDHRYPDEKIQRWPNRNVYVTFLLLRFSGFAALCRRAAPRPRRSLVPGAGGGPVWRVAHRGAAAAAAFVPCSPPRRASWCGERAARGVRDRKVETNKKLTD